MLISKRSQGLMGSGDIPLCWMGRVKQSGPMELTIGPGKFVGTKAGNVFKAVRIDIPQTTVPVVSEATYPMGLEIYALEGGDLEVVQNPLSPDAITAQQGSKVDPPLVGFGTTIPAGCSELKPVEIHCLTVIRGWLRFDRGEDNPLWLPNEQPPWAEATKAGEGWPFANWPKRLFVSLEEDWLLAGKSMTKEQILFAKGGLKGQV